MSSRVLDWAQITLGTLLLFGGCSTPAITLPDPETLYIGSDAWLQDSPNVSDAQVIEHGPGGIPDAFQSLCPKIGKSCNFGSDVFLFCYDETSYYSCVMGKWTIVQCVDVPNPNGCVDDYFCNGFVCR